MGTASFAATETYTEIQGMTGSGRKYVFSVPSATRVQAISNGKYQAETGRLVSANINNDLTTGVDPLRTFRSEHTMRMRFVYQGIILCFSTQV